MYRTFFNNSVNNQFASINDFEFSWPDIFTDDTAIEYALDLTTSDLEDITKPVNITIPLTQAWFEEKVLDAYQDMDPTLDTLAEIQAAHYTRNTNQPASRSYADVIRLGFSKLDDTASQYHRLNVGGDDNMKWVNANGLQEYVFQETASGWALVTDDVDLGTYNFAGPQDGSAHMSLDVYTWILFGNTLADNSSGSPTSTYALRRSIFINSGLDAVTNPVDLLNTEIKYADEFLTSGLTFSDRDGDSGNNSLFATTSELFPHNHFQGFGGDDTINSGASADIIDGGAGEDRVSYINSTSGVTLSLNNGYGYDGYAEGDTFFSIENVIGSLYADVIIGNQNANRLYGYDGNDVIYGEGGNDVISGGEGYDKIYGGYGNDVIYTGNGGDTVYGEWDNDTIIGGGDSDFIDGGSGNDTLHGHGGDDNIEGGDGIDTISGGDGEDELKGGADSDNISGGADNDYLKGGGGADTLYGGSGNDFMDGESGDDFMSGGSGNDTMRGGSGNDTIYTGDGQNSVFGLSGDDLIVGGSDNDTLYGESGNDRLYGQGGDDVLTGWDGDDVLYGQDGNDEIYGGYGNDIIAGGDGFDELYGFDGADIMYGGANNDVLRGENDNDILFAGSGDDILFGGDGNDRLYGDSGTNTLRGGAGNDIYYGGGGADTFVFDGTQGAATERVSFFQVGDTVTLSFFAFTGTADAASSFVQNGSHVIFNRFDVTIVFYNADVDDVRAAVNVGPMAEPIEDKALVSEAPSNPQDLVAQFLDAAVTQPGVSTETLNDGFDGYGLDGELYWGDMA